MWLCAEEGEADEDEDEEAATPIVTKTSSSSLRGDDLWSLNCCDLYCRVNVEQLIIIY